MIIHIATGDDKFTTDDIKIAPTEKPARIWVESICDFTVSETPLSSDVVFDVSLVVSLVTVSLVTISSH